MAVISLQDSPFSSIDDFDTEQLVQELIPRVRPADGPVLVWFKHDLRASDHPGLLAAVRSAAASGVNVIPFFCLDPALYADLALSPNGPAGEAAGPCKGASGRLMHVIRLLVKHPRKVCTPKTALPIPCCPA